MTSKSFKNVIKLNEILSVTDFGATADGSTDDAEAIQDAIDTAEADGARAVYFPPGTYLLSATLTSQPSSTNGACPLLIGHGTEATILKATHSSGPVLKVTGLFGGACDLTVDASSARNSGSAGSNYGILHEPPDASGNQAKFGVYERLRVKSQPSHGIVLAADCVGTGIRYCSIRDNLGHGIVCDNGTITSRTNVSRPGVLDITDNVIQDNTGNACVVGEAGTANTNIGYRINFRNNDIFRNALAAGVRVDTTQVWIFAENSNIELNAFGGYNGSDTPTTRGVDVAGRILRVVNNRYINVLTNAVFIHQESALTTIDVLVEGLKVTGSNQVALNPAISSDSGVIGVRARNKNEENITGLFSRTARLDSDVYYDSIHSSFDSYVAADYKSLASTLSLADDAASSWEFGGTAQGILILSGNVSSAGIAVAWFRVGTSPAVSILSSAGPTVTGTTGALTGTTGTDTHLTISAHTDNKLYIENRTAASRTYQAAFLSMQGSKITQI